MMHPNLKQVFELAHTELLPDMPAYRRSDALVTGADGEYFHENTRKLYAFFVSGLACGKVVARPGFKLVEVPIDDSDLV